MADKPLVALTGKYCEPNVGSLEGSLTTDWRTALWTPDQSNEQLAEIMAEASAVIVGADALLSGKLIPVIPSAENLRLMQIPFSGHDWLQAGMLPAGCTACNVYEHHTTIAEYVMANILEWQIGMRYITPDFRQGSWKYGGSAVSGQKHGEVRGKTVGILGYGRIGQEVAKRAAAFDMRVIAVGRSPKETPEPLDWLGTHANWMELVTQSDILVLTCPLTDDTRGIINADVLVAMKPSALLVNVARGQVAVEEDLYTALRDKVIAGAVLDVWYSYPTPEMPDTPPSQYPFHELSNTILSPHCAGWTGAQDERRWQTIAGNLDRLATGTPLMNVIRFSV